MANSAQLRKMIAPEALLLSPYEVLDYDATLILRDPAGTEATFIRQQKVQFLQKGVRAIFDHAWGDGLILAGYSNTAGALDASFKDEGRRHLLISLKKAMNKGEKLSFKVQRTALVGFSREQQRLETTIDHPVSRIARRVIFPKGRPCKTAFLQYQGIKLPLKVMDVSDGRTMVSFEVLGPSVHSPYTIHWTW